MTDKVRQIEVTEQELMNALASRGPDVHENSCPTPEVLNLLATGRLEYEEARLSALRHVATCDVCAGRLVQIKKSLGSQSAEKTNQLSRRPVRKGFVIAFAATLLIAAVLWILPRLNWLNSSSQVAVVDLRNDLLTRSIDNPFTVAHTARHLRIILPSGSDVGEYEIEIFGSNGTSVLKASGLGKLSDHEIELRADVDFRAVRPGRYRLELRHGSSRSEAHFALVQ